MSKNLKNAKARTLYLDDETMARLEKLAKRHNSSRSAIFRRLVKFEMLFDDSVSEDERVTGESHD